MELKQNEENEQAISPEVLKRLGSNKPAERIEAELEIQRLGADALEVLLAVARQEAEKRRKQRRVGYWFIGGYVTLLIVLTAVGIGGVAGSFGGMGSVIAAMFAATQLQKNTAPLLAQFSDVRVIGPMVDALNYGNKDIRRVAEQALVGLLPKMQSSDSPLLEEQHRDRLYKELSGENVQLTLAILKALEQVGDEKALPQVQKLAEQPAATTQTRRVREAAESCLPFLWKRIEQARAANTLLRATEPEHSESMLLRPAGGAQTGNVDLLRPASCADEQDPAILLRPTSSDNS